jgi:hypothetical protein
VKKTDVGIGPNSRRPARGSDDHTSKPKPGLPGTPTDAARTPQHKVLRLRSGFRLRVQTPAKRLNFTKKGAHSVIPSVALISGQLGADELLTDWVNPSVASDAAKTPQQRSSTSLRISPAGSRSAKRLAHTRKTAQHRSLDFARDFGSRLGRRESASTLQKTGIDP